MTIPLASSSVGCPHPAKVVGNKWGEIFALHLKGEQ